MSVDSVPQSKSLWTCSTGLCADSVESVPGVDGLFALATYQVDKQELQGIQQAANEEQDEVQTETETATTTTTCSPDYVRTGTVCLYSASVDGSFCEKKQEIETAAILDTKWCRSDFVAKEAFKGTLGVANAKGFVNLYRLDDILHPIGQLKMNAKNALCLSLDWSDRVGGHPHGYPFEQVAENDTSIIVSQSDGSLAYLPSVASALVDGNHNLSSPTRTDIQDCQQEPQDGNDWETTSEDERDQQRIKLHDDLNNDFDGKPRGLESWKAHDFEAWIAAFDCWSNGKTVWSGGDDLKLKGWDLRTPNTDSGRQPTFTVNKGFEGGVTSLQSHHLRQHIWAVGSYDSTLRLFDARRPLRPLETIDVGGVWRVKWHPTDPNLLLVACMHDGFKIVSTQTCSIVTRFDDHTSLAYGCDWDRTQSHTNQSRFVYSCSFYDARLHVWKS